MRRSQRRNPIIGVAGRKSSEKDDKRLHNRAFRRGSKQRIRQGDEPFVDADEVSNVWGWSKDGKVWLGTGSTAFYPRKDIEKELRK